MTRLLPMLVAMALLAPLAAAAPGADLAPAAPSLPDLRPLARGVADGASDAAGRAGDAVAAFGHAIAGLAVSAARAIGATLSAVGGLLSSLAVALAGLASALLSALASLGAQLASLLGAGARHVAAHPKESAIVGGAGSGVALLAYAAKRWWLSLFVPLYSRLAKSELLENRVRASVLEHVRSNPGAHPSAIAEALGLGWGTVVYHLARLEGASLVTVREAHHRKCFFVVGGDLDQAGRTAVAAMATDKARAIVEALRAEPGISQKDLAARLGVSQALASWHVKRLVASGVLVSTRAGRSNLLHVADHVPVVVPASPLALAA